MKAVYLSEGEPQVIDIADERGIGVLDCAQALGVEAMTGHALPLYTEAGNVLLAFYPGDGSMSWRPEPLRAIRPCLIASTGQVNDLTEHDLFAIATLVALTEWTALS